MYFMTTSQITIKQRHRPKRNPAGAGEPSSKSNFCNKPRGLLQILYAVAY